MAEFQIKNLDELADYFEVLASDQLASKRWQTTQKAKRECEIKSETYLDAANTIRNCEIKP